MVCVYCSAETQVVNSRHQRRWNQVWRRRKCIRCGAVFSTQEVVRYGAAWRVKTSSGSLVAFSKNTLFLSLYKSLEHRATALADAEALTDTVMSRLLHASDRGMLRASDITLAVLATLKNFDTAAAVSYRAFHEDSMPPSATGGSGRHQKR